jgi:hypothetical protein
MLDFEPQIFLFFILDFYILYYIFLLYSIMNKKVVEYRWGNNEITLKLKFYLSNWILNPNHKFWLLSIIENLGSKKTIIAIKKCANMVYKWN